MAFNTNYADAGLFGVHVSSENKEALEKMREAAEHHDDHHGPRCRRPRACGLVSLLEAARELARLP